MAPKSSQRQRSDQDAVLVFGASSQIGDALLPTLLARDWRLQAVSRRPPAHRPGLRWIGGGFDEIDAGTRRLVSLGPLPHFADWLERVVGDGIERIVAVGSLSLRHKRESSLAREREVAAMLDDAEQRLRQRASELGAELTLLRPCLLYGSGRDKTVASARRFAADRHWLPIPMPASGLRQPLHVQDLAEAIAQCLDGAAINQTLELGGGEILSVAQMLERIAGSVAGCKTRRLPLHPLRLVSAIAAPWSTTMQTLHQALLRVSADQLADDKAARAALDWQPRAFVP